MDQDWQRELEALLAALEVSMESGLGRDGARDDSPRAASRDGQRGSQVDCHASSIVPPDQAAHVGEQSALNEEIAAVRAEVEATLARVLALAREGRIEASTRDDIVLILRALLQPKVVLPPGAPAEALAEGPHEWEFSSAATVLRFCRLVLYLMQAVA